MMAPFLLKNIIRMESRVDILSELELVPSRTEKNTALSVLLEGQLYCIMDNGIVDNTPLFKVPDGHFFVMGDNRDN